MGRHGCYISNCIWLECKVWKEVMGKGVPGNNGLETWKIPSSRKWQPTSVSFSGKVHGQRSLAAYSPWGCKESDTTEWLSTTTSQWCRIFPRALLSQYYLNESTPKLPPGLVYIVYYVFSTENEAELLGTVYLHFGDTSKNQVSDMYCLLLD